MNNINPIWLRYGLIFGVLSILMTLIFYYVLPIGLGKQGIVALILMIVMMVLAGKAEKQNHEGILTYGEAIRTTFLTGVVGTVISGMFSLILMNLIDPSIVEKLTEQTLETTRSMLEFFGVSEDQIERGLEEAEHKTADAFTPLNQIFNILKSSIMVLIIAAIVSIFIKRDADPSKINVNDIGETGV